MSNIVVTSKNRILGIPVKTTELEPGEKIVATNAPMGMLYVVEIAGGEILHDYSELEEDEIPEGMPLALPLIEDYKNKKLEELQSSIVEINDLPD
jgi:hypothetical protein